MLGHLYRSIQETKCAELYRVSVSYVQVYNEKVYDLLNSEDILRKDKKASVAGLRMRWSKEEQFSVENLYTF